MYEESKKKLKDFGIFSAKNENQAMCEHKTCNSSTQEAADENVDSGVVSPLKRKRNVIAKMQPTYGFISECPYCGSKISKVSLVCCYCGKFLGQNISEREYAINLSYYMSYNSSWGILNHLLDNIREEYNISWGSEAFRNSLEAKLDSFLAAALQDFPFPRDELKMFSFLSDLIKNEDKVSYKKYNLPSGEKVILNKYYLEYRYLIFECLATSIRRFSNVSLFEDFHVVRVPAKTCGEGDKKIEKKDSSKTGKVLLMISISLLVALVVFIAFVSFFKSICA